MKVNPAKAMFLLVFKSRAFETLAIQHAEWLKGQPPDETNVQVRGTYDVRRGLGASLAFGWAKKRG